MHLSTRNPFTIADINQYCTRWDLFHVIPHLCCNINDCSVKTSTKYMDRQLHAIISCGCNHSPISWALVLYIYILGWSFCPRATQEDHKKALNGLKAPESCPGCISEIRHKNRTLYDISDESYITRSILCSNHTNGNRNPTPVEGCNILMAMGSLAKGQDVLTCTPYITLNMILGNGIENFGRHLIVLCNKLPFLNRKHTF